MRRLLLTLTLALAATTAMAQTQPTAQQMQQMQQMIQNNPQLQQQIQQITKAGQQVLGSQTINISKQRASLKTNCDENEFMKCRAGYSCTSTGASGATSQTTVRGRADGLCNVTVRNSDGSTGDCRYTDATMELMLKVYQSPAITVAEAMDVGNRVMRECNFVDAKGQPFAMPNINGATGVSQ